MAAGDDGVAKLEAAADFKSAGVNRRASSRLTPATLLIYSPTISTARQKLTSPHCPSPLVALYSGRCGAGDLRFSLFAADDPHYTSDKVLLG
jgi:hypothetical protein